MNILELKWGAIMNKQTSFLLMLILTLVLITSDAYAETEVNREWTYYLQSGEDKILGQFSDRENEKVYVTILNTNWAESLVSLDKNGNKNWTFSRSKLRMISVIKVEGDNIYVRANEASKLYYNGFDSGKSKLYKLDSRGTVIWEFTYNEDTSNYKKNVTASVGINDEILLYSLDKLTAVDHLGNIKWEFVKSDGLLGDDYNSNVFTSMIMDKEDHIYLSEKNGLVHILDPNGLYIESKDYSQLLTDNGFTGEYIMLKGVFKEGTILIGRGSYLISINDDEILWSKRLDSRHRIMFKDDILYYSFSNYDDLPSFNRYGFIGFRKYSSNKELGFNYYSNSINNSGIAVDDSGYIYNLSKSTSTNRWQIEINSPEGSYGGIYELPILLDSKIGSFISSDIIILYSDAAVYGIKANYEYVLVDQTHISMLDSSAKIFKPKQYNIDRDKIWTIEFNKSLNPSSVNNYKVFIWDRTNQVYIDYKPVVISNKISLGPIKSLYASNTDYVLYVGNTVESEEGSRSSQIIKMEFRTK